MNQSAIILVDNIRIRIIIIFLLIQKDLIEMDRVRIIVNEISNYKREGRLNVSLPCLLIIDTFNFTFIFVGSVL